MSFSTRFDLTETESRLYPILAGKNPETETYPNIQSRLPASGKTKSPSVSPVVSNHRDAFTTRPILERQTIPTADFWKTFLPAIPFQHNFPSNSQPTQTEY